MLIVTSGIDQLRRIAMNKREAMHVAHQLAARGVSFYCEPWPNERVRFYVDEEHARTVVELAEASAPSETFLVVKV